MPGAAAGPHPGPPEGGLSHCVNHSGRAVWLRFAGLGLQPGRTGPRGIIPVQARVHGIVTADGKCFRSVTNWIHLGDISVLACRLPSSERKVTERNVYPTVQCRPRRPSLPWTRRSWLSFTDTNVMLIH